jgi:ADP-ribose pyrophosphatase YjhB (NUDIX family)
MGYIEDLRKIVGNIPLILVRPTVIIINEFDHILLVQHENGTWGVPGGLMELGESVEESAKREVKEEINLDIGRLDLLGVFSGKELFTELRNGDQYYNVIIAYITKEYDGEIKCDGKEILDAKFYDTVNLPENTIPMIKNNIHRFLHFKDKSGITK